MGCCPPRLWASLALLVRTTAASSETSRCNVSLTRQLSSTDCHSRCVSCSHAKTFCGCEFICDAPCIHSHAGMHRQALHCTAVQSGRAQLSGSFMARHGSCLGRRESCKVVLISFEHRGSEQLQCSAAIYCTRAVFRFRVHSASPPVEYS
jgi:hypothetical protein